MNHLMETKGKFLPMLLKCFLSVLAVYLLFTPVFYLYNRTDWTWLVLAAMALEFGAVILVALFYRKKYCGTFSRKTQSALFILFVLLSGLAIYLHLDGTPAKFYGLWTSALGIYDTWNLFSLVLLEQLFIRALIPSFFLCAAVIFFPAKTGKEMGVSFSN